MFLLRYLRYVIRHKWFVLLECWHHGLYWRGLTHDLSKLLPSEFVAYARWFYTDRKSTEWFDLKHKYGVAEMAPWGASVKDWFDLAWLRHQRRNDHHWQWWILKNDDGPEYPLPMSPAARLEMLCDWHGAGRAITGKANTPDWYARNREKIRLHPDTRAWVEEQLAERRRRADGGEG